MSDVYKLTIKMTDTDLGVVMQPSLHYQSEIDLGGSEPSAADVASGAYDVWGTHLRAAMMSCVRIDSVDAVTEVIPPDIGRAGSFTAGVLGTLSTGARDAPSGACAIITKKTGTPSRSARGHFSLPGPRSTSFYSAQNWGGTFVTAATTLLGDLDDSFDIGTITAAHMHPVIYSRTRHLAGLTPYTFRVTGATLRSQIHWLRSRMTSP